MAKTKPARVLIDSDDLALVQRLARGRGASVWDVMREAAGAQLPSQVGLAREAEAVRRFLRLPSALLPEWSQMKAEIEDRLGQGLLAADRNDGGKRQGC